ncbi:hypothetical protein ACIBG8_31870 [Nonomuraea sp. NPDC050556]|uniref:hypothetical protein n=1 Tax=Nonomuraea sp. NPDC050556 TaxID=3364369 RepID=UPI00378D8A79
MAVLLHHHKGEWTYSPLPLPGGDTGAEALTFKRDRLTAIGYPSSRTLTWGPPG